MISASCGAAKPDRRSWRLMRLQPHVFSSRALKMTRAALDSVGGRTSEADGERTR